MILIKQHARAVFSTVVSPPRGMGSENTTLLELEGNLAGRQQVAQMR